jgi:hypothetical protein
LKIFHNFDVNLQHMKKTLLILAVFTLGSTAFAQIPNYVPTSDLLCWWPLNGTAVDLSQNNLNGTCFNTTSTFDRFGNPCSAIACNGTELGGGSTIVSNGASFNIGQNAYTINLWFKPNNLTQVTRCLFNTDPHTGIGIGFNDNNAPGYLVYDIGPANAFWNSLYNHGSFNSFQPNVWYCMTFVKNGSDYSIYINGALEHTINLPISTSYNFNVTWRLSGISDLYQIFDGDLDDFGFWNRALTQSEINDLYLSTFTAFTPISNVIAGIDQSICAGDNVTLSGTGGSNYQWNNNVVDGQPFAPAQSSTYVVTAQDSLGCTGTDTVVVTVLENATSTLTETALDSFTLNGQAYTQSGTYTQTLTAANGCDSTITLNLTLNFTGIDELGTGAKKLVKITDLNGKTIPRRKNTLMLFIYEDGTVERVLEMEE